MCSLQCRRIIIAVAVSVSVVVALVALGGLMFWLNKKGTCFLSFSLPLLTPEREADSTATLGLILL
jgi:hypothetical protein